MYIRLEFSNDVNVFLKRSFNGHVRGTLLKLGVFMWQ